MLYTQKRVTPNSLCIMLQCDRKRPACARCTQLGLVSTTAILFRDQSDDYPGHQTGLCVYEVDDPTQRSDTQDESARLLKRVAELEGVIREVYSFRVYS